MSLSDSKRFFTRGVAAIAVTAIATLGLAGCAQTSGVPGAAFKVSGQTYSESDLTVAVDQWENLLNEQVPRDRMAGSWASSIYLADAASDLGIEIPDEAVQETIAGIIAANEATLEIEDVKAPVRDLVRSIMLSQTLNSGTVAPEQIQMLQEAVLNPDIQLNPRYGSIREGAVMPAGNIGDGITLQAGTPEAMG